MTQIVERADRELGPCVGAWECVHLPSEHVVSSNDLPIPWGPFVTRQSGLISFGACTRCECRGYEPHRCAIV